MASKSSPSNKRGTIKRSAVTGRFVQKEERTRITKYSVKKTHPKIREFQIAYAESQRNLSKFFAAIKSDSVESSVYLNSLVIAGVPVSAAIHKESMITTMIAHHVLPRKTWEHAKKSKRETLTPANSERFIRVLRITEKAKDAFGEDSGEDWMETPTSAFGDRAPIEMLTTESGARAVELYLGRVMHGFNV